MEKEVSNESKLRKVSYWAVCFFVLCLIGWGIETVEEFLRAGIFTNRGFAFGPYLPIYAFGAIIYYVCLRKLMKKKMFVGKINLTPVVVFLAIIVLTAIFEYFVSWILEVVFDQRWWCYNYEPWNLNGRIFLKNLWLFGIAGMVYLYAFEPFFRKALSKVKTLYLNCAAVIMSIILAVDITFSIIVHWGYR